MAYRTLTLEVVNQVGRLTLNRPQDANAIDMAMGQELMDAAIRCDMDPEVRAVLLTGAGKMFCGGGDLKSFVGMGEAMAAELKALRAAVRIEVSNGAGRLDMAMRMGQYLVDQGMKPASLTNAISFTNKVSVLYFRPGYIASAKSLSRLLPVDPELRRNAALRTELRLVLGGDLLDFDRDLIDKSK